MVASNNHSLDLARSSRVGSKNITSLQVALSQLANMSAPTSLSLALVVLVLLPFDIITWILRFHVRLSRKAWGPDDWSMVVAIVSLLFSKS